MSDSDPNTEHAHRAWDPENDPVVAWADSIAAESDLSAEILRQNFETLRRK